MEEKRTDGIAGMSRRSFALGASSAIALIAMGGLKVLPAQAQVRPPGGQDEDRLISACIRCERCVEACPRGALEPTHVEDGILSVRTPTANFNVGWCDFCEEENNGHPRCVEFCPTGALSLKDGATPQTTIMGCAVIIQDWCLAWSKLSGCRFCYDACPYDAIQLDEYERPMVIKPNCTGCGACQTACVSQKEGSIAIGSTSRAIVVKSEKEV